MKTAPPDLIPGAWMKVTGVTRVESQTDRVAPISQRIAAAHARKEMIQALIGRPDVHTGQCIWLYCNLFPDPSETSLIQRSEFPIRHLQRILSMTSSWVPGHFGLSPRSSDERSERRAYGPADVIYGDATPSLWMITAIPLSKSKVEDKRTALGTEITRLEGLGAGSRITAAQIEREIQTLDERLHSGLWEVATWAGSSSEASAAGVLHGLSQMSGIADGSVARMEEGDAWLGASELAALLAPPDRELPGIRLVSPAEWDRVPERQHQADRDRIVLGTVLAEDDTETAVDFSVSRDTLNRHVFVCGATGSGKSVTVRTLLASLAEQGIPWLVIEPSKAEYHAIGLAKGSSDLVVLRPGDRQHPAGGINPLEPTSVVVDGTTRHFPLQTHIDLVRTLFEASFESHEPFPQVLSAALQRSYETLDWDLHIGQPRGTNQRRRPVYPTLGDLRRHALSVVEEIGYGSEVRDNVRGFIQIRLGSLDHGTPGRFFNASHDLDLHALAQRPAVLQLESIGSDRDQAFVLGAFLIRWVEMLRLLGDSNQLNHVLAIEEAHRLLRVTDDPTRSHAIESLANLLAEVRAYGQGLVIAEQIPTKIISDVVKNSALKIVHRLPAEDDRSFVGATMNLSEGQSRAIVGFRPGEAAVHADGMDGPLRARVHLNSRNQAARGSAVPTMAVRSPACQGVCGDSPCTVQQLAQAQRLSDSWKVEAWVDLVVLAHLAGRNLPSLGQHHRDEALNLVDGDHGRLRCGVAGMVGKSVKARWRDVVPYQRPEHLIVNVTDACAKFLEAGNWGNRRASTTWQVRNCRWIHIEEALMLADSGEGSKVPHPETSSWQDDFPDLHLPNTAVSDQLLHLRRMHAAESRDVWSFVWGEPSVIRHSLRSVADIDALGLDAGWPAELLFHRWASTAAENADR